MRPALVLISAIVTLALVSSPALANDDFAKGQRAFDRGDFAAAMAAWRAPAEKGDPKAQLVYGRLLLAHAKRGGIEWIQKSADAGHIPAEFRMGWLHRNGLYVAKSPEASVRWLQKAIGHDPKDEKPLECRIAASWARYMLADDYWEGTGVSKDRAKSRELAREAADAGNAAAQFSLGLGLEGSEEPDLVEAHKYYVLAWKQGYVLTMLQTPIATAKAHALAIRKKMTPEQLAESKQAIRAWFDAKDEGKLGWVFNHRKQWSRGDWNLETDTDQEVYNFQLVRILGGTATCDRMWLRSRDVIKGRLGVGQWRERWTVDTCGEYFVVPIGFRRLPDRTLVSSFEDRGKRIPGS